MVAGIVGVGFGDQAFAMKPKHLICYAQNGSFDGDAQTFEGIASCTQMGKVSITGTYSVGGIVDVGGIDCLNIVSSDTVLQKKGNSSVTLATDSVQCFFDENGAINVGDITSWCGITSTVDGEYTVTSGTGKFSGKTGEGTIHSDAEHCGDTIVTQIRGSLD